MAGNSQAIFDLVDGGVRYMIQCSTTLYRKVTLYSQLVSKLPAHVTNLGSTKLIRTEILYSQLIPELPAQQVGRDDDDESDDEQPCEKTAPKLTHFLTFSIFVKNKIIKKQPVLNHNLLSKLGIKSGVF